MLLNAFYAFSPFFEINEQVNTVKISLSEHNFLHLSDVYLKVDGEVKSLRDYELKSFSQSSLLTKENSFQSWYEKKTSFFSTKNEKNPSIAVNFLNTFFLEGLIIINRSDGLWERARKLKVGVGSCSDNMVCKVDLGSTDFVRAFLDRIDKEINTSIDKYIAKYQLTDSYKGASKTKAIDFLHFFVESIDKKPLPSDTRLFEMIVMKELICQGDEKNSELKCAVTMGIYYLLRNNKNVLAYKFFRFHRKLLETKDILKIQNLAKKVGLEMHGYELVMGAHKFTRSIRSWDKSLLIGTLLDMTRILQDEFDVQCLPFYGTLLGLYRDKDFIAHDDDLDMLAITTVNLGGGMVDLNEKCVEVMKKHGFKAVFHNAKQGSLPFVQVVCSEHDVHLDIFWGIAKKGTIAIPMDKMNYREVDASVICPVKLRKFGEFDLLAPNDIEAFLEQRYGQWRVPDSMFRANE